MEGRRKHANSLNRLCSQADDHNDKIRCKHGFLLQLKTSWTNQYPGRRYWACPYYGENLAIFFGWKDGEIDDRSIMVIPKLIDKICKLEDKMVRYEAEATECVLQEEVYDELTTKMELESYINKIKNLEVEIEWLKETKKENENEKEKKFKFKAKKNMIWFILVCAGVIFLACKLQLLKSKDETMQLP